MLLVHILNTYIRVSFRDIHLVGSLLICPPRLRNARNAFRDCRFHLGILNGRRESKPRAGWLAPPREIRVATIASASIFDGSTLSFRLLVPSRYLLLNPILIILLSSWQTIQAVGYSDSNEVVINNVLPVSKKDLR